MDTKFCEKIKGQNGKSVSEVCGHTRLVKEDCLVVKLWPRKLSFSDNKNLGLCAKKILLKPNKSARFSAEETNMNIY